MIPRPSVQVDDDPELLALMRADGATAPAPYQTTNYWQFIDWKLMAELRQKGLRDFRARHQSPLASAGATDLRPLPPHINLFAFRVFNNRFTVRIAGYDRWLERIGLAISRRLPLAGDIHIATKKMGKIALDRADYYGAKWRAKPLADACDSLIGNPEWVIEREGLPYTISFLNKYLDYAYCCPFIDFDSIRTVVELGPGSGRQAEVLKKFHPHLTLYLFDIPPQLYVCEQYLKKVFPDATVGYRKTRALDRLPEADGRIYLFSNAKFPLLGDRRIDLFWNAASLQEMEPDVVANYLSFVNGFADAVFVQACMAGKQVARSPGFPGVLKPTTIEHYRFGLAGFECRDRTFTITAFGDEADEHLYNYENSFWRRRIKASSG
ncbi:MAG: putative sugar O-methyltransferase [Rhodospirillales bacterium]|nr:putative sugar O-methyltransferase [Rhodospirillales bacterium]